MSFSLANPTGWTTGDTLTETQINQIDAEHAAAIDGSGGGSYSLTNPLSILGDTVTFDDIVSTNANISYVIAPDALIGNLTTTGNTVIGNASGDTATINATSTFAGDVTCTGSLIVSNDSYIGSDSSDAMIVASQSLFNGNASFTGTVECSNNVTLGTSTSDLITVGGIVSYSGGGRTRETGTAPSITGDTVSFDSFRHILIMSTATTPATFTITGTDANGEWFILQNDSSAAHTIASSLFTGFSLPANSGVKMLRFSGVWFVVQRWT